MSSKNQNPFLASSLYPEFDSFHVEHISPAVDELLTENMAEIERLANSDAFPTWENFVEPLEQLSYRFEKVWGPVGHLDAVKNSDAWHDAYLENLTKVTDYHNRLGQHKGLFKKFQSLRKDASYERLSIAQKKVIDETLKSFRLSGIDLPSEEQETFKALSQSLSQASSAFSNNVLKATQKWSKHLESAERLAGLPDHAKALLKQLATQKDKDGYLITLDFPSYLAVMTYAEDRSLREEVYRAFSTRASDQFEFPEFDNSKLMDDILSLRLKKARLLKYANFAELSLATKMAESPNQVIEFLEDLAAKSKPQAFKELDELTRFAQENLPGLVDLQPWDVPYFSEKYKQKNLSLSQEMLRPYFPVEQVLTGLFKLTHRIFSVSVREKMDVSVWHDDVRCFELLNDQKEVIAAFYLDLYARENKRGGAWMDSASSRWKTSSSPLHIPIAYLVCNFTPPIAEQPACLTHDEVTTLFHEFGHGLHHMLTEMIHFDISGINGVPWDAVELPSQFMENFCWHRESLDMFASHVDTKVPLPEELLQALQKGRQFQAAMMMVRQIEFALFDMRIHIDATTETPVDVLSIAHQVREQVAVIMPPHYHRFPHSFSHIFAGGYAAGYYSYKWAEVLSSDAFGQFEEDGILNSETGAKFRNTILAAGGSMDPMVLFKAFRGRAPSLDPLLRHSGIQNDEAA